MPRLLSQLVQNSADRHWEQVAFRCQNESMDYGSLFSQSNRLANLLIDEGVRPGDRVGILLPRCLESAVAVHGVLSSGGAYVPMDPNCPIIRLRQIVNDCGIRHLITNGSLHKSVSQITGDTDFLKCIVGIEELETTATVHTWGSLSNYSDRFPHVSISENDLAYVMYTSGSTGQPKGIMHTHFSGMSYARLSAQTYDVVSQDCIGNHSPLHFDMSTFGYFVGPLAGATTVIIPAAYTKLPASLSQLIETTEMTIWYSVPFALIQLLLRGAMEKCDLNRLRWVHFGGEPFPSKHLFALMEALPQARFSNIYGPAEVNQCTYYHVPRSKPDQRRLADQIPIGKTWELTKSLVLVDEKPVESGEIGELLISSPTMMKGYWNRPDLDQKAFYHSSKNSNDDELFYRTGDLVRVNEDGEFLFLGRLDRQIKLRGHRIELDDIEVAISSHPAVEEVGVFPVIVSGQIVEIGATILLREPFQGSIRMEQITLFLIDHLPSYSLPTHISFAEKLPRTTSGKIDRRQLQASHNSLPPSPR